MTGLGGATTPITVPNSTGRQNTQIGAKKKLPPGSSQRMIPSIDIMHQRCINPSSNRHPFCFPLDKQLSNLFIFFFWLIEGLRDSQIGGAISNRYLKPPDLPVAGTLDCFSYLPFFFFLLTGLSSLVGYRRRRSPFSCCVCH